MAVKEKVQTNPCTQIGAYVSTPGGLKAYVIGALNDDRVLIEYALKDLGTDNYNPSALTLIQAAPQVEQPEVNAAKPDSKFQVGDWVELFWEDKPPANARTLPLGAKAEIVEIKVDRAGRKRYVQYKLHLWGKGGWIWQSEQHVRATTPPEELDAEVDNIDAISALTERSPLDTLAAEINQLHQDCESAIAVARSAENSALQHAKLCGEKLLEAKQKCGHGNWESWRNEHIQIPSSTATLYQRVAERWNELAESTTVAELTLREAAALLKKPRQAALQQSEDVTTTEAEPTEGVSEALPEEAKPVHSIPPAVSTVNPRECLFTLNGKPKQGKVSGVFVDWSSLSVAAVLVDHDVGQTQVPISKVQLFD